jgi:hypothetical protein
MLCPTEISAVSLIKMSPSLSSRISIGKRPRPFRNCRPHAVSRLSVVSVSVCIFQDVCQQMSPQKQKGRTAPLIYIYILLCYVRVPVENGFWFKFGKFSLTLTNEIIPHNPLSRKRRGRLSAAAPVFARSGCLAQGEGCSLPQSREYRNAMKFSH